MSVKSLLGFAQNAGQLVPGSTAALRAVEAGKAYLLIIACDASERLERRVKESGKARHVSTVRWGTKEDLGRAVGKRDLGVVAVCDSGFAGALEKEIGRQDTATGEKGLGDVYV